MNKKLKAILSFMMCVVLVFGSVPFTHNHDEHDHNDGVFAISANAWEQEGECEHCGGFIGDSWICEGGEHCSEDSEALAFGAKPFK